MQFRLALAAGCFVACSTNLANAQMIPDTADGVHTEQVSWTPANNIPAGNGQLTQRRIVSKPVYVSVPRNDENFQMAVKFLDSAKVRIAAPGAAIGSGGGANVGAVEGVLTKWGLTLRSMFEQPQEKLEELQRRAEALSGMTQPDLGGMMIVEWPANLEPAALEAAANELNQLEVVEFVEFIGELKTHDSIGMVNPNGVREAVAEAVTGMMGVGGGGVPNLVDEQRQNLFFDDMNGNDRFDPGLFYWLSPEYVGGVDLRAFVRTGEFILDNGLQSDSWNPALNGGRGHTVNVGVIEFNANLDHIDLRDVILEPHVTLLPPELGGFSHWNHGTATLGQIVGKDHGIFGPDRFVAGDNRELGITGIAPGAQGWFFPTTSMQGGSRLQSAIISAFDAFTFGDVLSFSIGQGNSPLIASAALATLFQLGGNLGILSCMSAGNECTNLDDTEYPLGDAGTIVVGAGFPIVYLMSNPIALDPDNFEECAPDPTEPLFWDYFYGPNPRPHVRHGFSNFYIDEDDRVHTQAWGANIVTTGYGDRVNGLGRNRLYTSSFGGTSGACPMIAGACVCIQGLSKMFFGNALGPTDLKNITIGTQFFQDAQAIEDLIFGVNGDLECGCNGDPCDEGCYDGSADSCQIGGLPVWDDYLGTSMSSINNLFNINSFGSNTLEEFYIVSGRLIEGNLASLAAADASPLLVASEFNDLGQKGGTAPVPNPVYFMIGQFTDVAVVRDPINAEEVLQVGVTTVVANDSPPPTIVSAEVYDWVNNRWEWSGVLFPGFGDPTAYVFNDFQQAGSFYVNPNTEMIWARVWVFKAGFGAQHRFNAAYDLISVDIDFGGIGGGPGGI